MRPSVKRNHARFVDHLVSDRDEPRALDNLVGVPVDRRHHRTRQASGDTPVVQAQVLGTVPRAGRRAAPHDLWWAAPRCLGQGRDPAVGRIDHQRRSIAGSVSTLGPMGGTGEHLFTASEDGRRGRDSLLERSPPGLFVSRLTFGEFGVGDGRSLTQLHGPFERHVAHGDVRKRPLNVRVPPGGSRRRPRFRGAGRRRALRPTAVRTVLGAERRDDQAPASDSVQVRNPPQPRERVMGFSTPLRLFQVVVRSRVER